MGLLRVGSGLDIDPGSYCSGGPGINKTAVDVEHYGGPGPLSGFPGDGTTGDHGVISDHPTDCEYGDDLLVNNGGEKNGVETLTTSEMDSFVNLRKYATEVQQPSKEDLQPSYARSLTGEGDQDTHGWYGNMINSLGSCIGSIGAIPCAVICPNPYKPILHGNVGLITKFGRFYRAVDTGLVKVDPQADIIAGHQITTSPSRFYKKGRVFKAHWTEPAEDVPATEDSFVIPSQFCKRLIQAEIKIQMVEAPKQQVRERSEDWRHFAKVPPYGGEETWGEYERGVGKGAESSSPIQALREKLKQYDRISNRIKEARRIIDGDHQSDLTGSKPSSYDNILKKYDEGWWDGLCNKFNKATGMMSRKDTSPPFNKENTGTWKFLQSPFGSNFIVEVDRCKEDHRWNSIYGQNAQEDLSFQPISEITPKKKYVYIWHCCACRYFGINIVVNTCPDIAHMVEKSMVENR